MSSAAFASELASALEENRFGLKGYQVIRETQLESTATVVFLEGHTVTVSLSPRGFEVGSRTTYNHSSPPLTEKLDPESGARYRSRDTRTAPGFP